MPKSKNRKPKNTQVEENIEIEVSETVEEVVETVVEEVPEVVESVKGIVTDCIKLNIRKSPSKSALPVCVVGCGTVLIIDNEYSNDEWFKVSVMGLDYEGYCMKQFVKLV